MNIGKVFETTYDMDFENFDYATGSVIIVGEGYNWIVCQGIWKKELYFMSFDSEEIKNKLISRWVDAENLESED